MLTLCLCLFDPILLALIDYGKQTMPALITDPNVKMSWHKTSKCVHFLLAKCPMLLALADAMCSFQEGRRFTESQLQGGRHKQRPDLAMWRLVYVMATRCDTRGPQTQCFGGKNLFMTNGKTYECKLNVDAVV